MESERRGILGGHRGFGLGNVGWPILLIAIGVLLLFRNFLPTHKPQA